MNEAVYYQKFIELRTRSLKSDCLKNSTKFLFHQYFTDVTLKNNCKILNGGQGS